jgi:hypothetical protein
MQSFLMISFIFNKCMVQKEGELTDLLNHLERCGIFLDNGAKHNSLRVARNPDWDQNKRTLFKYVITSKSNHPLNFSITNKDNSPINYIFFNGWVNIIQIHEPDEREYSVHVIREGKDAYSHLDYIALKND